MRPIDCTTMKVGDRAVTRDRRKARLICVQKGGVYLRNWGFLIENKLVNYFFERGNLCRDLESAIDLFEMPATVEYPLAHKISCDFPPVNLHYTNVAERHQRERERIALELAEARAMIAGIA